MKKSGKNEGVVFSKKAHMWLYYLNHNNPSKPDTREWFATEKEASDFLKQQKD